MLLQDADLKGDATAHPLLRFTASHRANPLGPFAGRKVRFGLLIGILEHFSCMAVFVAAFVRHKSFHK